MNDYDDSFERLADVVEAAQTKERLPNVGILGRVDRVRRQKLAVEWQYGPRLLRVVNARPHWAHRGQGQRFHSVLALRPPGFQRWSPLPTWL